MSEGLLKALIVLTGAAITVASSMVAGLRIHKAVLRHMPWVARLIPRDGGVILGFLLGAAMVTLWFVSPFH